MIKICHIADVHFRSLQRHVEYKTVFDALIEDAKKQNVDVFYIGGDLWHTKTQGISPEFVDLFGELLTKMSAIAPVHMILGNHDGLISNANRQDAITPIVSLLNNPRIFLYKKSGVYEFLPGYTWCVFSLFDEEGWDNVKPQPDKYNIACFHGCVRGAKTEADWMLTDGMSVDFFKDYDLCLLGDIHKFQFLDNRQYVRDDKKITRPWIGYCGSLVQQNFAEDLVHGWLYWQIYDDATHDVSFMNLPNPNPFVTVDWMGSIRKTIKNVEAYPNGSRIRIRSNNIITQNDVQVLTNTLKEKYQASEITYKIDESIDKDVIIAKNVAVARNDLRNCDVLIGMMKEHYETEEIADWDKITELVKSYMHAVISTDEIIRNTNWSIKRIEFDNTFSYGENNVIDFSKLSGITGIFGPNRTGKSSIIGTIMYALFNSSDRGSLKNVHVINTRKNHCLVKTHISINGLDYLIERQTTRAENKKGQFGITSLNAFQVKDGVNVDLNGEQRTDTEKIIRKLIGNADDFMLTSLASQDDLKRFIKENATPRKAIVSRFLDLDFFDRMYDVAKNDVSILKSNIKNLQQHDFSNLILQKTLENESIVEQISQISDQIDTIRNNVSNDQLELSKIRNKTPVSIDDLKTQKSIANNLENKISTLRKKIHDLANDIDECQKKIDKIENVKNNIDIEECRRQQQINRESKQSILEITHRLEKESSILQTQKRSVLKLLDVPCGDSFPTCKYIKDSHVDKSLLDAQQQLVSDISTSLSKLNDVFNANSSNELDEKIKKVDQLEKAYQTLQATLVMKQKEHSLLESSLSDTMTTFEGVAEKIKGLEMALENSFIEIVSNLESEIKKNLVSIRGLESKKINLVQQNGRLQTEIERLNQDKNTYDDLTQKFKIHELIANAFSKRGIPNHVIKNQLPIINSEIAKILNGIVNFTVELETDLESNSLDVFINYGDSKRIIELGSGMEKMIASLAIRVALLNVSSLPKTDLFIIDEGFTDLDESGIEACNRLICSLKKYFKNLLIITHIEAVKETIDNLIEITRTEHDSKVTYE